MEMPIWSQYDQLCYLYTLWILGVDLVRERGATHAVACRQVKVIGALEFIALLVTLSSSIFRFSSNLNLKTTRTRVSVGDRRRRLPSERADPLHSACTTSVTNKLDDSTFSAWLFTLSCYTMVLRTYTLCILLQYIAEHFEHGFRPLSTCLYICALYYFSSASD